MNRLVDGAAYLLTLCIAGAVAWHLAKFVVLVAGWIT